MVTVGLYYQNITTNPTTPTVPAVNPLVAPITIQAASPSVAITGDTVNGNIVTLRGTALSTWVSSNLTIQLFDGSKPIGMADTDANGNWTFTTNALAAGTHTFTAIANDFNGYVSPVST